MKERNDINVAQAADHHDKDGDGKLDMWSYFKKGKMVREGYDRNGDGQPDDWKHFD